MSNQTNYLVDSFESHRLFGYQTVTNFGMFHVNFLSESKPMAGLQQLATWILTCLGIYYEQAYLR
jgi:hypothetical protein